MDIYPLFETHKVENTGALDLATTPGWSTEKEQGAIDMPR